MSQLTEKNVRRIFFECIFDPDIDSYDVQVLVPPSLKGRIAMFNCNRVQSYATEIRAMLNQLPAKFQQADERVTLQDAFLNKDGTTWTHDIGHVQELLLLGMACIYVSLLPTQGPLGMMDGDPFIIINLSIE